MNLADVEQKINLELSANGKSLVNRNAIRALFGVFSDPVGALGQIFLGRQDVLDAERQRLQQEAILVLVCRMDDALTEANKTASEKGIVLDGLIETSATNADELIGVDISGRKQVRFESGTQIRTTASGVGKVTGLKIQTGD